MRMESIHQEVDLPSKKLQTKCTKMTDEGDSIRSGLNGVSSVATNIHVIRGNAINAGAIFVGDGGKLHSGSIRGAKGQCEGKPPNNTKFVADTTGTQSVGGRLQFFKDGKFILELARAREGEKAGWVSVPRKTFWPPSVPCTSTPNYLKNEGSTSLSFSDDNSSVQSSPWQRDHCWKQTSPRRDISLEMCMFFKRTRNSILSPDGYKTAQKKKRRPFDKIFCKSPFILAKNGLVNHIAKNNPASNEQTNAISNNKIKPTNTVETIYKSKSNLVSIIQKLIDKLSTGLFYLSKSSNTFGTVNHFSPTSNRITDIHNHQQHVSPRKRILRELEKVSLEDSTKRSRAKNSNNNSLPSLLSAQTNTVGLQPTIYSTPQLCPSNSSGQTQINGSSSESNVISSSTQLISSYSINALLGTSSNNNIQNNDSSSMQNLKDYSDPSSLQLVLSSTHLADSNTHGEKIGTSTFNSEKMTPKAYLISQDHQPHNRSPSSECQTNYVGIKSPETFQGPESLNFIRYKAVNNTLVSNSISSGFHPYLSTGKCGSPGGENIYKSKMSFTAVSPTHNLSKISSNNRSSTIQIYSQPAYVNNTSTPANSISVNECSPIENVSPNQEIGENSPRMVPKKAAALRQRYCSSVSTQIASTEQKRKFGEDRIVSTENKFCHSALDLEHTSGILRSSVIPSSALYYLYPPHSSSSYISPVSYYHPISSYAAAVAALRNPLWMHDPNNMPTFGSSSRLASSVYPYNGISSGLSSQPLSVCSTHLSNSLMNPWTSMNQEHSSTGDPVELVNIKDEPSSDVPLNLSKH